MKVFGIPLTAPKVQPLTRSERIQEINWGGSMATASGKCIDDSAALKTSAVFSCVKVLTESVMSLPLVTYKRLKPRGKERATKHPLYSLLHDAPTETMDSSEWLSYAMLYLCMRGNFYAKKIYGSRGEIAELIPVHPDNVRIDIVNGQPIYIVKGTDNKESKYTREWIYHVKGMSLDGIKGLSPIDYARETIGLSLAAEEHGARFFSNGTTPSGLLVHPAKLSKEAHERLRDQWLKNYGGSKNSGATIITEEGMKFEPMSLSNEQSQFIETRKFQRSDIASWFRVPPHMIGDLERATFCLPASETVLTENGPRSISSIREGELVWSYDNKGAINLKPVIKAGMTGEDEILEIKTTNRTLRCNAKHPILCRRKYYVPKQGGSLQIGGAYLGGGTAQNVEWRTEYVAAGSLTEGDTIVTLKKISPRYGTLKACPTRKPSIEFMEFCGLLIGDGNVFHGSISIARAENASYMDYYRKVIRREFQKLGKSRNGRTREAVKRDKVHIREGDMQTRFSSVIAAEELKQLGLSGTARTKRVPDWIFKLPESHRLGFLRGFLDADGSCDKKGRLSFSSCNAMLLTQMRCLCMMSGIPVTNLRYQIGTTLLPNGKRKAYKQYCFTCSDPLANQRIGSRTAGYVTRMEKGKPFNKKARNYPRFGGKDFKQTNLELSRINKISLLPKEPVYDLCVADNHSFIAEGVIVHNSNIEQQSLEFVTYSLTPWFVRFERSIKHQLMTSTEKTTYFVEFLVDALLRGDGFSRAQKLAIERQNGIITANEWREIENRNPIEGEDGDTFLTPLNMQSSGSEADTPDPSPNVEDDENRALYKKELRETLFSALKPMISHQNTKVFNRISKAIGGKSFDKTKELTYIRADFVPVVEAIRAIGGNADSTLNAVEHLWASNIDQGNMVTDENILTLIQGAAQI